MRETGGTRLVSVQAETRATAIRIGNPASWKKAIKVIQQTGGTCEQVSEIEIAQAKAEIGQEGIGCEPASAVTAGRPKEIAAARICEAQRIRRSRAHRTRVKRSRTTSWTSIAAACSSRPRKRWSPYVANQSSSMPTCPAVMQRAGTRRETRPGGVMKKKTTTRRKPFRISLPATSANLGPAFDAAALGHGPAHFD